MTLALMILVTLAVLAYTTSRPNQHLRRQPVPVRRRERR